VYENRKNDGNGGDKMIRVVVVGLGTMGLTHINGFARMKDVELAGVVDTNQILAKEIGEKYDTQGFTDLQEASAALEGGIDVVSICLPTHMHVKMVKKAADIGAHVICEKPLARSLNDAREIIEYCHEKNVRLFVGHVVRFFPEYVKVKELLEQGKIGKVGVVRTSRGGAFPRASEDWYANYDISGGLILDMIIHDFDFLRWCFGEVEHVYAKSIAGVKGRNELHKDYALVTLRFKNGVIAHVEGTWAHQRFSTSFEFAGKDGIITYNSEKEKPVITEIAAETGGKNPGVSVPESPLLLSPYDRELQHFISCIKTGEEPIVSSEDAFKAVEIALAAMESIEIKQPVVLNRLKIH
jgi:predicted dehydrogenase